MPKKSYGQRSPKDYSPWGSQKSWTRRSDLLQEGLGHTQVCCTQSLCPCGSPLLTRTSAGDTQTRFCLSLCGVSGPWCTEGLSEHLWRVWGLILNTISPLLPSCWGFFFAVGRGISPQSFPAPTEGAANQQQQNNITLRICT